MISGSDKRYRSRLEVTKDGNKLLIVEYDSGKLDWDEAIAWATQYHKLSSAVQVVALPNYR